MTKLRAGRLLLAGLMLTGTLGLTTFAVAVPAASAATSTSTSKCPPGHPPSYPPGQCHLTLSSTTIHVGGSVTASGCGFHANALVSFTVNPGSIAIGTLTADAGGCVNGTVTLSTKVKAGSYNNIEASGMDPNGFGYALFSDPITVTSGAAAAVSAVATRPLPKASTAPLGWAAAVVLLAVGSGLVVRIRRTGH